MALVLQDRVRETTQVTGTGSATLLGAVTGYQSFSVIGNGNTTYYTIADQGGPNWETGIGTWSTGGTLARTTVLSSSNGGSLVNFTTGTKDVFVTQPSEKAVYLDALNTATVPQLATSSFTSTTPVLSFNGSNTSYASGSTVANNYLQTILQNKSGTAGASTNYVLSNDLGTDSSYYGEFGMNSSVFSSSTPSDFYSINNGVYFSGHDGDITVGSGNGYKLYFAWGSSGASAHVINASGAIGLSTNLGTTPATSGTTGFGTSGQVLTSQGSASAPIWTTPTTGTVTSVSGTAPISVATGTTTPVISISQATTSTNGYLSSTDWNTFNNKAPSLTYTTNYVPYGQGTTTPALSVNFQFNGTKLTLANDATIHGLTVGLGGGSAINTAFGASALAATSTGNYNTGIGNSALNANTSGALNTALGQSALTANTSGSNNAGIGAQTLQTNTTGSYNTAVGDAALYSNTTASQNTAVGYQAGYSNTTGTNISAFGYGSLYSNTTGFENTALGHSALYLNTTGQDNTAIGKNALVNNSTGSYNTAVGAYALASTTPNTTASNNTAVGYQAAYANTTGANGTFIGNGAGAATTTGAGNTFIGASAGASNTTGVANTFVGPYVFGSTASGLLMTTGSKNSIFGGFSGNQGGLDIRTSSNYIVLSDGDGNPRQVIDNNGNVGIGTTSPVGPLQVKAASGSGGLGVITASHPGNTTFGVCVMAQTYSGTDNPSVCISNYNGGSPNNYALAVDSTGDLLFMQGTNPASGFGTERMRLTPAGILLMNTTGQYSSERLNCTSNNIVAAFVGTNAGNVSTMQIVRSSSDGDGITFFQNTSQRGYITVASGGTSYNSLSDYRLKENIKTQTGALERILALNPVSFDWIETKKTDEGFIAHELQAVIPGAVQGVKDELDDEGKPRYQGVDQAKIVSVLVKAVQELNATVTDLQAKLKSAGVTGF